jgi:two-component system, NtrC family, sensor histidine kinase GlrK
VKIGRPRTLLGLILVGLGVLTLPLLIGVGNAVVKLGQLADETEAVVSASMTGTLHNQRIASLLPDMERNALQYLLLLNPQNLTFYETDNAELQNSLAILGGLPQTEEISAQIEAMRQASAAVLRVLAAPSDSAEDDIDGGFRRMTATAAGIATGMRVLVNNRLNELQETTRGSQTALAWQAAALIPGTLILVLFFLLLIGRPMRQVDRAIRELGKGDFGHAISVTGPSDIETLGRQLEWLRHRLKESTEEKNKFLRHMSHELKPPLAIIREGADLLLDGSVGALEHQQQEVAGILRDNSLRLQKLIENLLTFSAWQTKTAALELSEFELKPLVFTVLSQHRLVISNRKIKLDLDISPVTVRADEGKLRLVLDNLLSNALKFTPDGGTISIRARMGDGELLVEFADTGPGVAREDVPRIFEAFFQGRRPQGGPVGGTGIGLSVVRECVHAHGGHVELMNRPGAGAVFRVRLPLRRVTDPPQLVANG